MGTLSGKGALVTGGSRGIGRAIVERLTADGAEVVFSYRVSKEAAHELAERTGAHPVQADLGNRDDLSRLFSETERLLPHLDILVNNAGGGRPGALAEYSEEEYDRTMAVNTKAVFLAMRWAAKVMRDGGRIINISTLNTDLPVPGTAVYAASKAAIEQFAKVAARELGGRGITVNSVAPGATDTDLLRAANSEEGLARATTLTALQRLGRPADIAAVVAFLAGPDGGWITGQNIRATGGMVL
ncbi:SDR family oxidoreductase [Thermostaphylospora chromogena]|uniref:3-oxoacyl-[acyl-carrier protein] reductase n=1 Tax=Thermostaphylospora chromogena TaxID=35622 RepID=A0A1H1GQ92_9ACTN|nr:SDR family oxidoreductase [Thermostaphylospora chromogena]SDR15374.1 3-oxoacyl-[acyl-carrier protein] reductase [Thermostaphylospora chromogena]